MSKKLSQRAGTRHFSCLVLGLVAASVLLPAGSANALTLGALAPPNLGGCGSCDVFQRISVVGQPLYKVPPGLWTITSWSAQGGGTAAGKARLRVYRPTATPNQYKLMRQSSLGLIPASGHPTFAASIDVRGGDLLGIETVSNVPSAFSTSAIGPKVSTLQCDPTGVGQLVGAGTPCPLGTLLSEFANIKATLIMR
jgi:hypothetical protein